MATSTETPPRKPPAKSSSSFSARMTAKVGPLPVWAWALVILVVGYVVYKRTAGSSSSSSTTDTSSTTGLDSGSSDATAPIDTTGGTPGPDATGGNDTGSAGAAAGDQAGNLNDELLSQLAGFGSSIDALTAAVSSSPAFWPGSGDSGSGSLVPNGVPSGIINGGMIAGGSGGGASGATTKTTKAAATIKPAPVLVSEHGAGGGFTVAAPAAKTRYYTYAPGKAPKGQTANEAPARGPSGTTLHFASGRGYYYA